MEVLTRGSIDEGPIVLALPPIFEGLLPEGVTTETDPIFTAWDKTTGISIYKDQIVDRSYFATQAELDLLPTDTDVASAISANNADYIPYSGATTDVDLGTHTLHLGRAYAAQETPIASTEYATKGYADALAFNGAGGITPTVAHNDTTGKEGGGNGHWYHLSDTINAVIPNITQSGSDIVPLGLSLSSSGISTGLDGLAYVVLTWTAIVSDTFDHYQIEYKKSAYTYYTPLSCTTNTITIEGLTPNTSYNFHIASVNRYGTSSAFSTDLILTTPADSVAPATVSGVTATGGIQYVIVEWTNNTDVDLASYNVYVNISNDSSTSTKVGNCKANYFIDGGKTGGTPYYYWLKAVDTSGNLSTAYSTVATATPRNVTNTDIVTIAGSKVLIDGVVYLSNWQKVGDLTKIDGGSISANTITTTQLNFTPIQGSNVIASINASPEGIQIDADNFAVSGSSVFTSKVGGSFTSANSVPRIRIFPNTDIGIEIVDDLGNNVFSAEVGGTNLGDVTIGNWAGNQGIKYDKSANSTSFAGTILASAGTIGGWTINSTYLVKDTGTDSTSSGMAPLDYPFYAGATYADRASAPFKVYSNGNVYATNVYVTTLSSSTIPKSAGGMLSDSGISDDNSKVTILNRTVDISTTTGGLIIPRMTTSQRNNLQPAEGMVIYNTTTGRYNFYEAAGGTGWYTPTMGNA